MKLIHLLAYILVWSIIPIIAEYSAQGRSQVAGQGADFALWSVLAMTAAVTIYGFHGKEKPLRESWRSIWFATEGTWVRRKLWFVELNLSARIKYRLWFVMLSVFTVASHLSAVLAFQGGFETASAGSATVANLVDSVGSFCLGMLVTAALETGIKWTRIGGLRLTLFAMTLGFSVLFILVKDINEPPDWTLLTRPAVYFGLSWSAFTALNNQFIRDFAKAGIPREDFLFWRFAGPTLMIAGAVAVRTIWVGQLPSFDYDKLFGLVALAVGCFYSAVLQFSLLKDRTVANLNTADLVIPGLTFLLAILLGRAGERTTWFSFVAIAGVLVCRGLAEILPAGWPGWAGVVRSVRGLYSEMAREPTVRIAGWLLRVNVVGLLLTLAMFSPVVVDFVRWMHSMRGPKQPGVPSPQLNLFLEKGYWPLFLLLFVIVSQLIAMTFLARRVRVMMRDELLGRVGQKATELAHDLKSQLAQGYAFLHRLTRNDLEQAEAVRVAVPLQRKFRRGLRLVQAFLDAAKGEKPFFCNRQPTDLVTYFAETSTEFNEDLLRGKATFAVELDSSISEGTQFALDADRLSIILENLVDNSKRAWLGDESRDRFLDGLKMMVKVHLNQKRLCLIFTDTGPGMHADQTDALDAWISGSPGGYGLGNYIIRRYVAGHDGDVTWETDQGCKVTIFLRMPENK